MTSVRELDRTELDRRALRAVDVGLASVHDAIRAAAAALAHGRSVGPASRPSEARFDELAALAEASGLASLYRPRIDELRLEAEVFFGVGEPRRRANARRYGERATSLTFSDRVESLGAYAERLVRNEVPDLTSEVVDEPSRWLERFAQDEGLAIRIVVDPSLVADAASGESTLFLADRPFRRHDLVRLGAHEIRGHLVAAANARDQPLRLLRVGTAGAWDDQEGVALAREHEAGVFDGERRRKLGARAIAALVYLEGGDVRDASAILESLGVASGLREVAVRRAYRSGGSARDLAYLQGIARVGRALERGEVTLDRLRLGRVSVAALPSLEALVGRGLVREPAQRPSFAYSRVATFSGTSFDTSPPSRAASFTRFDAT